ncbi:MAG TPA: hypothetical protein VER33_06880 [Polyangiaceae bacterium]|nr:hypothetical protein [Polyangiaceae bacterium]
MLCGSRAGRAEPSSVVLEIDALAERWLDTRTARRLVLLEVADVSVPAQSSAAGPALFYRILGAPLGLLRIELWERGEFHAARIVSSEHGGSQLVARRVALAAAELARGLRQKRLAREREHARRLTRERLAARAEAQRTLSGPLAVRAALLGVAASDATLFGSALSAQVHLGGTNRLDLGVAWLSGFRNTGSAPVSWLETRLGPARRFALTPRLDLDVGLFAAAAIVHLGRVDAVDAIPGQHTTWSARAGTAWRIEPRLSRTVRLSVGLDAAWLLRPIISEWRAGSHRFEGFWAGADVGVVLTPE